ncbi:prepilin peptidase [Aureimonas sp. SK2]|uniref:A24 family peptidase n=1 Tax=Aureimonas sp. SK2 TaxID=3015992 RepID=UPI00244447F8|nr:prepilin peptidase [Aureimonas sp. SK2]
MIWCLLLAFPAAMLAAAIHDLATMEIPNWLVAGLCLVFFPYAAAVGSSWEPVAFHAASGFVVLILTFGCFTAGWMGGGDAKLIAAVALWLGLGPQFLSFLVWMSIFGGILTLGLLLARRCFAPTTGLRPLDRLLGRETGIPYGVAIGAAGLAEFPRLLAAMPL